MSPRAPAASWVYRGIWSVLTGWFRVPTKPPSLPADAGGRQAEHFQPARAFLRYLKMWFWVTIVIIDLIVLVGLGVAVAELWSNGFAWLAMPLAVLTLIVLAVPHVLFYLAVHLRYDTTHYVMSDRSLRIRRGIWSIEETTITFENVQNLRVSQGPIQRLFGIADLRVETAGGGGGSSSGGGHGTSHRGVIEGVTNAVALRDRILPHLRQSASAGLGDDDGDGTRFSPAHLAVLREIEGVLRRLG
ncbi:MAG: PH domain-containing protein [Phycisphaerales bacterium]|nr:PH domain-containing protein [Phycisphaerales bacterium]NNM25718.1 PH domain-containing protein [Phycisphaerales bacterium]